MSKRAAEQRLTPRQQRILEAIRSAVRERGYPPSVREIGDAVGLASPSSVAHQLRVLEEYGLLRRDPNRPRAIEIRPVEDPGMVNQRAPVTHAADIRAAQHDPDPDIGASSIVAVPLVGTIAAGGPILAEESVEAVLPMPIDLVGHGDLFMLRIRGDSMIDAAICDADYVVVRRQPDAVHGDIVAALLGDEATVKTFERRDGHAWLMPRNPAYDPVPGDDARILGKVVSVLRRL